MSGELGSMSSLRFAGQPKAAVPTQRLSASAREISRVSCEKKARLFQSCLKFRTKSQFVHIQLELIA